MELHHIALVCHSETACDRFYGRVLGLEKQGEKQIPADVMNDIFQIPSAAKIINYSGDNLLFEIFITDTAENTPISHHCLSVADRDAFLSRCQDNNVVVRRIPKNDGTFLVFMQDDDRNQFEIKEIQ